MDAIIFDIDGTLIDNSQSITNSYIHAFHAIGRTDIEEHQVKSMLGNSMNKMLEQFNISKSAESKFTKAYTDHQKRYPGLPKKGITALLKDIHLMNIPMGIVTSKLQKTTDRILTKCNLEQYFDVIITSADVEKTKPHPEGLYTACEKMEIEPGTDVIYIGDSKHDIEAAKNAGISWIGVTWGNSGTELYNQPPCVDTVEELRSLILKQLQEL